MKTIIGLIIALGLPFLANAQDISKMSNRPATHIQATPNASWQNNSQFYNKDNHMDMSTVPTANGTYWQPGYSNPLNSGSQNNAAYPSLNGASPLPTTIVLPNSMNFSK